jgi:dTDP-4-amino-4,6-dideoxygalactose transaminase
VTSALLTGIEKKPITVQPKARRLLLSEPDLSGNEETYLSQCVQDGFVSSVGRFVDHFESSFASFVSTERAVACASGTAALHLAMLAAGVGRSDEVWVSDLTFIASVNPVRYLDAIPVFIDSDPYTWNIDPEVALDELDARVRFGKKLPRAIVITHLLGWPAELERLALRCEALGIALIEDAAESVGATMASASGTCATGTRGRFGCFSFNGNKIMTTGGGGMVVANSSEDLDHIRHLSTQAKIAGSDYLHDQIGFNYRMTNIAAALGVAQLERLSSFIANRSAVHDKYKCGFANYPIVFQRASPGSSPNFWLTSVLFESESIRDSVRMALAEQEIETRPIWTPMHLQPVLRGCQKIGGENAVDVFQRSLSLPSSAFINEGDQGRVIDLIRSTLERGVK